MLCRIKKFFWRIRIDRAETQQRKRVQTNKIFIFDAQSPINKARLSPSSKISKELEQLNSHCQKYICSVVCYKPHTLFPIVKNLRRILIKIKDVGHKHTSKRFLSGLCGYIDSMFIAIWGFNYFQNLSSKIVSVSFLQENMSIKNTILLHFPMFKIMKLMKTAEKRNVEWCFEKQIKSVNEKALPVSNVAKEDRKKIATIFQKISIFIEYFKR